MRHNMNFLSETYLSYEPIPIESLIGEKGASQKNMREVPVGLLKEYAVEDADITWQRRISLNQGCRRKDYPAGQ